MNNQQYHPPPGPPPGHNRGPSGSKSHATASPRSEFADNNPWRSTQVNSAKRQRPSSRSATPEHHPPPGPPSASSKSQQDVEMKDGDYKPPPGPPPGRQLSASYEPPSGPPPNKKSDFTNRQPSSSMAAPPPYDPWYGGPDEQLRPPPSFSAAHPSDKSPTANASYDDAKSAHTWCRQNPLWPPSRQQDPRALARMHHGDLRLTTPPDSDHITVYQPSPGHTYIRTGTKLRDTIFLSDLPIYAANTDSPLVTGRPRTVYFELHVLGLGDRYAERPEASGVEAGIAVGFAAPPYPAWRLPGWHRGSLGVHGDDGRRYVDDSFGGRDFTAPFRKGDVVGVGLTFAPPVHGHAVSTTGCQVFFTRNGQRDGGWNLFEERDANVAEGDTTGLEGEHDLLAAVGVFGGTELEAVFRREDWKFRP